MDQLRPFTNSPSAAAFQILCDLDFLANVLQIRYRVHGPIGELVLPPSVANPHFRDELWTTTCLEIFLQKSGQSAYEEWNFSPSGNWAHYHFSSYRVPSPSAHAERREPLEALQWIRNDHQLLLQVKVPLDRVEGGTGDLNYGLSAVLHLKSGEKQYWALHHAGEKPDFHLAESFTGCSSLA